MKNDQIKDRSMLNEIVQPLTDWYRQNKRILPWRDQNNAYYKWVSEIMLQQTRVEAVKPYFQRFIGELPDVQALAECPEDWLHVPEYCNAVYDTARDPVHEYTPAFLFSYPVLPEYLHVPA